MAYVIREVYGIRKVQHSNKFGYFLVNANEDEHIFENEEDAQFVCKILKIRTGVELKVFEIGAEIV